MNRAAIARANLRELNKRGKSCRIRPTAEPSRSNLDKFGTCVLDVSCTVVIKYTTRHAKILCHKLGKNYLTNISPTLSCIQFHASSKIEIMWHTQNFTKRLVQSKSPLSLLIHPPPGRHRLGTVSWMEPWVIRMMWCQHMSCLTNTSTCNMKRISCEMLLDPTHNVSYKFKSKSCGVPTRSCTTYYLRIQKVYKARCPKSKSPLFQLLPQNELPCVSIQTKIASFVV